MKRTSKLFNLSQQLNYCIAFGRFLHYRVPLVGRPLSKIVDRLMLTIFGIDLYTFSIDVKHLSIPHPVGVLLGGNGVYSTGRVVIMGGVKLGGGRPSDPLYIEKHKIQRVFEFGDNVVISTSAVLIGPMTVCDNVIIGPMSLVNKSITEPGIYVGNPARKVSSKITEEWVAHLPAPVAKQTVEDA